MSLNRLYQQSKSWMWRVYCSKGITKSDFRCVCIITSLLLNLFSNNVYVSRVIWIELSERLKSPSIFKSPTSNKSFEFLSRHGLSSINVSNVSLNCIHFSYSLINFSNPTLGSFARKIIIYVWQNLISLSIICFLLALQSNSNSYISLPLK